MAVNLAALPELHFANADAAKIEAEAHANKLAAQSKRKTEKYSP